jgi:hypothetical protein
LAALHVSLAVLTGFLVAVGLVVGFEAGRVLVEEHFGLLRASAYVAWSVGIAAFLLAPVALVKELGLLPAGLVTMGPRFEVPRLRAALRDAGGRKLVRAFGLGFLANALVLALSPLGLWLGDGYTWDVFRIHLVASTMIVALSSGSALLRVRSLLDELAFVPQPGRVGYVEPTGI